MPVILAVFLFLIPFLSCGQYPVSPDIIFEKCAALYKQGKLDSVHTRVRFFRNRFNQIDSVRWFYVYTDTIKEGNGNYCIGKRILDPEMSFNGRMIGVWSSFYPDGQLCSKGSYGIGAYNMCMGGAPSVNGYDFREKDWHYWYDNGHLMAQGTFRLTKEPVELTIGRDTIVTPVVTARWRFYNRAGIETGFVKNMADSINRLQ